MRVSGRRPPSLVFICLLAPTPLAALSFEGRVVNIESNEPVPFADVTLTCLTEGTRSRIPCKEVSAKTSADGTFRFDSILPVKYRLATTGAAGLVPTRWSKTEIDVSRRYSSVSGVVLKLAPESNIIGKVLDEAGQPKPAVEVAAFRQIVSAAATQIALVSKTITNDKGVYLLRSLVPGNYYVATPIPHEDKNDAVNPYLFFAPSALSLDQASLTHVDTGQSYSDIDLHLRPLQFYRLQGRAQMETAGSIASDPPTLQVDARDSSGVALPSRDILLDRDGRFETDVLPGSYTLRLSGALNAPPSKNSEGPAGTTLHLLAKQDIDVSGKDIYGIILLIPPPITVTGRAYLDNANETKPSYGRVVISPVETAAIGGSRTAGIQPDGTFAFTNCDPASYVVRFLAPSSTYVKSISFNDQDVSTQLMDLSRGTGGQLTVVLRANPAALSGTITDAPLAEGANGAPKLYDVALIPDLWRENGSVPIGHATSKDGRFSFSGIPPGHYTAISYSGVESRLWEVAKFVREMQSRGVGIDLAENDQKQIAVPYLALADIDQIEYRLGIN
jgi:hypothetical protein